VHPSDHATSGPSPLWAAAATAAVADQEGQAGAVPAVENI